MNSQRAWLPLIAAGALATSASAQPPNPASESVLQEAADSLSAQLDSLTGQDRRVARNAVRMLKEGRDIFRYDTFGDEVFWGDTLQLHRMIAGARFGGVGPGLSPKQALSLGLKVDAEALPASTVAALKAGRVNLDDPAVTLALLKANAVVGLTGRFANERLVSLGAQCALCHSVVDDSLAPGVGRRLDGWANRDLNIGAIIASAPDLSAVVTLLGVDEATVKKVLLAWGPGKFDAELNLDGKGFRPDGKTAATLIPPAFGMAGVNLHTWTGGWGTVTYWNAFVANLELQGQGNFWDPRLNDANKYPIAARAGFGNKRNEEDHITSKLAALHFYQLAIPGWNTHKAEEIGIDDFQANRSPDESYRTVPLRGLGSHSKGGFYHDGRFAQLIDVVNHYDSFQQLGLSGQEKRDLVEYLKSL